MRKSPEERTKVIDWMDKIIEDCNKWISGECYSLVLHPFTTQLIFSKIYSFKNDVNQAKIRITRI